MTIFSKNLGGYGPFAALGYAYDCRASLYNFRLNYEQ